MKAFISDIHANFEALCAVFDDISQNHVDEIICLGDIIGYGPDPQACTDMVMEKARIILMGNHDHALIHGPAGFNSIAAQMIELTRGVMDPDKPDPLSKGDRQDTEPLLACMNKEGKLSCIVKKHLTQERWNFIEGLPQSHSDGDLLYVHGSPLDPTFEYIFPSKMNPGWNPDRIEELFVAVDRLCFCGHTHLPCVIGDDLSCVYPKEVQNQFTLDPQRKYIINIGSVGQPRDLDPRSCYLLFDEKKNTIEWRRVEYNIDAVVKKIESFCGEENWCGVRLTLGR